MHNNSYSTISDINSDYSEDYEISSISKYFNLKEKVEKYEFEQAFYNSFHSKDSTISDFDDEKEVILSENSNQSQKNNNKFCTTTENIVINNIDKNIDNQNIDNENNLIGKKHERNKQRFKVNKINPKREIAFTTFNSKFNKYLNDIVNKKIADLAWEPKFCFTDEIPFFQLK